MLVEVNNVSLTNVWQESFKDRETGEVVEYYRALISSVGEPPAQLAVAKEDYEALSAVIGFVGKAMLDIDAQPNRRIRVYLKGME